MINLSTHLQVKTRQNRSWKSGGKARRTCSAAVLKLLSIFNVAAIVNHKEAPDSTATGDCVLPCHRNSSVIQMAMNKLSALVPVLALCFAACTFANVYAFSTAPVSLIARKHSSVYFIV